MKAVDKKKISHQTFLLIKISVFFLTLLVFAFIGILLPLRPKTSSLEKRELASFPQFTVKTFLNGDYFADIDTWYADTYPLREPLIAVNAALNRMHGLHDTTVVAGGTPKKGDEIPTGEAADAGADVEADIAAGEEPSISESAAPANDTDSEIRKGIPETFGDVYITQGRAFELFYFVTDYSNRYCKALNTFQEKVGNSVTVYDLVAPVNSGIILSDEMQKKLGSADQKAAADYIFTNLDERIRPVAVYDNIKKHSGEYIYFRTDHHWTQRGAYYAYEEFARVKGLEPHSLDDFDCVESDGFLGSFYSGSRSPALEENADTVTAYIPNGTNELTGINREGASFTGNIVSDGAGYQKSDLYLTFIKGDNPYSEIHNPQITDGSELLIIKESYANCLVPLLVDHYQDIYIVDYRYYQDHIYSLIQNKGIKEVLFVNNLSAINADNLVGCLERLVSR